MKLVGFLQPILVEHEGKQQVYFADLIDQKVFDINLKPAPEEAIKDIFSDIVIPNSEDMIPMKEIYEIMDTEKQLTQDNDMHIFRRN